MIQIEQYRNYVKHLAANEEPRTFLNEDEDHALEVLIQLFSISKQEVRIFAGCLCKHVGDKDEYVIAISDFIERGGRLKILLNAYDEECVRNSNLYRRLYYYKTIGKEIIVKTTEAHPYLTKDKDKNEVHFTIGDNKSYRIETDVNNRTAECNFNNPQLAVLLVKFFDNIFNDKKSKEVNLENIFNDGNK